MIPIWDDRDSAAASATDYVPHSSLQRICLLLACSSNRCMQPAAVLPAGSCLHWHRWVAPPCAARTAALEGASVYRLLSWCISFNSPRTPRVLSWVTGSSSRTRGWCCSHCIAFGAASACRINVIVPLQCFAATRMQCNRVVSDVPGVCNWGHQASETPGV